MQKRLSKEQITWYEILYPSRENGEGGLRGNDIKPCACDDWLSPRRFVLKFALKLGANSARVRVRERSDIGE